MFAMGDDYSYGPYIYPGARTKCGLWEEGLFSKDKNVIVPNVINFHAVFRDKI